ncbi:MAG: hypothetical protein KC636_23455, partial [Myxococcales bacterium]|nr:hypothetical protein [Myxococcales bacterium]
MFDPFKNLPLARAFLGLPPPADPAAVTPDEVDVRELVGQVRSTSYRIGAALDVEEVLERPGVRELYENGFNPPPTPLAELASYMPDTLGHEYARYLKQTGWRPVPGQEPPELDDAATYIRVRTQMIHGILHVVTQYDTSVLGELALQAFLLAQTGNQCSVLMVAAGLVNAVNYRTDALGDIFGFIAEAHERGRASKHYLSLAWEELWPAPIEQVRTLVELPPRSGEIALLDLSRTPAVVRQMTPPHGNRPVRGTPSRRPAPRPADSQTQGRRPELTRGPAPSSSSSSSSS